MKFLADENFPLASVRLLRINGWDVTYIAETYNGAKDIFILNKAVNENSIILTFDRDYGELIFKHKYSPLRQLFISVLTLLCPMMQQKF